MPDILETALAQAVRLAKAPGAVAYVGDLKDTYLHAAVGERRRVPYTLPAERDTIYDLASLTKVVCTATLFMKLVEEGRVTLDQPAGSVVPIPSFNRFTFRNLITHTAGLSPSKPWYRDAASMDEMLQRAGSLELAWRPGTRRQYSDIGFMILGRAVELLDADTLDASAQRRLFQPLGMKSTTFKPPSDWWQRCAPTENCQWRNRIVLGEVHDENAYAVGGVSGHAGLFSTAGDLAIYSRALLSGKILRPQTLEVMGRVGQVPSYPWQGIGWKLDPWEDSVEGYLPARAAIGHTGWTGTSIWMDRATGRFAILLSNTCHPSRVGRQHTTLRTTFYGAVAKLLYPASANTHVGLDRLAYDSYRPVAGRRIALLTNHASTTSMAQPILDALRQHGEVILTRIFSPEHGLFGQAEAGAQVASQSGGPVPITSLYGGRKQPTAEELRGIDQFVIDLQDVGSRYYTYAHTMLQCMRACAAAGVPVLVLDRPNPVGGMILEGPLPVKANSAVCWAEVPVRHGMTLGEIALFFQRTGQGGSRLQLEVKELGTWPRAFFPYQCTLPWAPPSPNIPTPGTALVYVGTCLFEGTNLNEGRGTDTPFHLFGAPWLEPAKVFDVLPDEARIGCALWPTFYTPRSIAGKATTPRYQDQLCRGIRINIASPEQARPFTLALALIRAIRDTHPEHFAWEDMFDVLTGGPWLREQVEAGRTAADILAEAQPAIDAFNGARPRLYS